MADVERIVALPTGRDLPDDGIRLNEPEAYRLLDDAGIDRCRTSFLSGEAGPDEIRAWAATAAELAGPAGKILLKVVGRNILHKTEAGGVRVVDVKNPGRAQEEIVAARATLAETVCEGDSGAEVEGWLAAEFVDHRANTPGQELLLAIRQDPAFGPCVVVGIGGTLTEWYGDVGNSTLVFGARELAAEHVREAVAVHPALKLVCTASRLYPEAPVGLDTVVEAVLKLAELAVSCAADGPGDWTLEELELNPVVASRGRLVALDGVGLASGRRWPTGRRSLDRMGSLLHPRSAVVFGVSARSANPGRIILDNLRRSEGVAPDRLYVVHQQAADIDGVPCFASAGDLPEVCDLAVVSVPAEGAYEIISDVVAHDRARSIILIPGGFAEAGATDLAARIESVLAEGHARSGGGPVMVGGNCLGIVSRDNYNTFFLPDYKLPFRPGRGENLALVSQSGAYLVTFASNYDGVIQPAASISFGNQMDLTAADFLEYFAGRENIDVIAVYVEGFRAGDGVRFLSQVRRARAAGKKVIVFKAGKTALGAKAAASHTASLAGDYAVARSCLTGAGVVVAETLDEFEDLIKTFTLLAGRSAGERRVGIISNAGFECSAVMDRLEGLRLADFDAATRDRLDEVLPSFAHRDNPIDCTPMTGTTAYAAACRAILEAADVDVAILAAVPVTPALDNLPRDPQGRHGEDLAGEASQASLIIDIVAGSAKPAVVVVDSGDIYDPLCRVVESAGIPVFRKIDRAAAALSAYCRS